MSNNMCKSQNVDGGVVQQLATSAIEAEATEWGASGGARALQRDVTPCAAQPALAAFSCHPTHPRRLLAATNTGIVHLRCFL